MGRGVGGGLTHLLALGSGNEYGISRHWAVQLALLLEE